MFTKTKDEKLTIHFEEEATDEDIEKAQEEIAEFAESCDGNLAFRNPKEWPSGNRDKLEVICEKATEIERTE